MPPLVGYSCKHPKAVFCFVARGPGPSMACLSVGSVARAVRAGPPELGPWGWNRLVKKSRQPPLIGRMQHRQSGAPHHTHFTQQLPPTTRQPRLATDRWPSRVVVRGGGLSFVLEADYTANGDGILHRAQIVMIAASTKFTRLLLVHTIYIAPVLQAIFLASRGIIRS